METDGTSRQIPGRAATLGNHEAGLGASVRMVWVECPNISRVDLGVARLCWADQIRTKMSLAEILPEIRGLSAADKLRLIRLLAEEVDAEGEISPLEHGRTYTISTPIFEPGASEILQRELNASSTP